MAMPHLPVELLGRIFVECLPRDPYIRPDSREAPLLLTLVCRHWRAIALSTPQLWRSLCAILEKRTQPIVMSWERLQFYARWLSRSGSLPLTLKALFDGSEPRGEEWGVLLRQYRGRFRRLKLFEIFGQDVNLLLDGADMLEHLVLNAPYEEGVDEPVLTITKPNPPLRTLVLNFFQVCQATLSGPGWATLTRLAVRLRYSQSYPMNEFLRLIGNCPNLEGIIFGPIKKENPVSSPRPHANLRSLCYSFDDQMPFHPTLGGNPFANLFVMPRLLSLRESVDIYQVDLESELMRDLELEPSAGHLPLSTPAAGPPRHVRSLELYCEVPELSMFDLGWAEMTHLKLEFWGLVDTLHAVLARCTNLQELDVATEYYCSNSRSPIILFTHPTISSLRITARAEGAKVAKVFNAVTLPGLRDLFIVSPVYPRYEDVRTFLVRSRSPLEVLKIKGGGSEGWTKEEQRGLRRLLPTLTCLDINA